MLADSHSLLSAACDHALCPPRQPRRLLLMDPPLSQSAGAILPFSPSVSETPS